LPTSRYSVIIFAIPGFMVLSIFDAKSTFSFPEGGGVDFAGPMVPNSLRGLGSSPAQPAHCPRSGLRCSMLRTRPAAETQGVRASCAAAC
jgi:hypothetical protein